MSVLLFTSNSTSINLIANSWTANVMSKNKKYDYQLEQIDSSWNAQITRKVSSKKVIVSKEKKGFDNESEAKTWAENEIARFIKTQNVSNLRQASTRKLNEETREQRSARRAEKTARLKASQTDNTDSDQLND